MDDAAPDTAGDLAPDLAADGVADVLLCYERIGKVGGDGETLRFAATDTGDAWHVTLTPDGIVWEPGGKPADVTVSAPVAVLLMVLNRRRDPVAVDGDATLFERWRAGTRF
jgi:predicted lipid carrier protein YhbT